MTLQFIKMAQGVVEFDGLADEDVIDTLKERYMWTRRPAHPGYGPYRHPYTFYMSAQEAKQEGVMRNFSASFPCMSESDDDDL